MRDVIVVGAGGGGAVIAKELASRGLDVLLLEAGPRFADPERDWTHFESDANNPASGYFRFASSRIEASRHGYESWPRARSRSSCPVSVAPRITTGQLAASGARSVRWLPGNGRQRYDDHVFPFAYRNLISYYEWVEHTLPVATAPVGLKEDAFFKGAQRLGLPLERTKDITRAAFRPQQNAILQPGGNAGRTDDAHRLAFPHARGCTVLRPLLAGMLRAAARAD